MKKSIRNLISMLVILAIIACVVPTAMAAEPGDWTSLTEHYTINADGTVTANGVCEGILEKTNFCLNNNYIARGDYSVSVLMLGAMVFPNTTLVQQGIIPWYQDADNYLFVYIQWSDTDRPNQMHQLHISGKVNGEHLGWFDCWTDGVEVPNNALLNLIVAKEVVDGCVKITYTLSNGAGAISNSRTLDAKYTEKLSEDGQMGIYAYGNGVPVLFGEFVSDAPAAAPSGGEGENPGTGENPGEGGDDPINTPPSNEIWTSLTQHYTLDGSKVVSTGAAEDILHAQTPNLVLHNSYISAGDFTVSTKLQGSMGMPNSKHVQAGIIPWYLDADNYLYAYVEWSDTDRPNDIRCIQVSGKLNGTHIGYHDIWCDGISVPANEEMTLSVQKTTNDDGTVKLSVQLANGQGTVVKTGERTLDAAQSAALAQEGKLGLFAFNDTVSFTEFSCTGAQVEDEPAKTGDTSFIYAAVVCAITAMMGMAVLCNKKRRF